MQFENLSDSTKKSIENYRNNKCINKNMLAYSTLYFYLIDNDPNISNNEIDFVLRLAEIKNFWRK